VSVIKGVFLTETPLFCVVVNIVYRTYTHSRRIPQTASRIGDLGHHESMSNSAPFWHTAPTFRRGGSRSVDSRLHYVGFGQIALARSQFCRQDPHELFRCDVVQKASHRMS